MNNTLAGTALAALLLGVACMGAAADVNVHYVDDDDNLADVFDGIYANMYGHPDPLAASKFESTAGEGQCCWHVACKSEVEWEAMQGEIEKKLSALPKRDKLDLITDALYARGVEARTLELLHAMLGTLVAENEGVRREMEHRLERRAGRQSGSVRIGL